MSDNLGIDALKDSPFAQSAANQNTDENPKKSISMHEDIPDWCDCCSCEAEPYWVAVAEELGIDLGGDAVAARDVEPKDDHI